MTRKALTILLYPLVTCGLGCADWDIVPLQQTKTAEAPAKAQPAPAAADPDLTRAPRGDSIDPQSDNMAADAVRKYLADLDAVQRNDSAPAARYTEPRGESRRSPAAPPAQYDEHFGKPRLTHAAAEPAKQPEPARKPELTRPAPVVAEVTPAVTPDAAEAESVQANAPVNIDAAAEEPAVADARRPQVTAVSLVGNAEPTATSTDGQVAANTAMSATGETVHSATLDELIEQARTELAKDPANAKAQYRLSLLLLAAGRPAEAGELSPELTESQRGLIARQVAVNAAVEDVLGGSGEHANQAYAATEALRDALRQDAELVLPVLTLCTKVTTFGVYTEMPDSALVAYRANRAIIYCEVRNLATEGDEAKGFTSLLSTRMELFGANGQSLWQHEEQRIEDRARHRREDFFVAQLVTFPPTLAPGKYTLKATVTDLIGNKTNETVRELHIGGTPAAAAGS
ncbi:MAG TPA: hypothetical protein P5572_18630 [Phycisphaerae bacterium]|nr:hypothetical protein [Phycisphaerae bacterium]